MLIGKIQVYGNRSDEKKVFVPNPDQKKVDKILKAIEKKNGHCPCQPGETPTNFCPCSKLLDEGECICELYVEQHEEGEKE